MKFHLAMKNWRSSIKRKNSVLRKTVGFGLCLIMTICFQSTEASADTGRARVLYILGYQYYEKQDWENAADNFLQSYREETHSLTALMLAASSYYQQDARGTREYACAALEVVPPLMPRQEKWARDLLNAANEYLSSNASGAAGLEAKPGRTANSGEGMTGVDPAISPLPPHFVKPKAQQLSGVYTIRQKSNGRYVYAHKNPDHDYSLVTRPAQNNDTQRWILTPLGNNLYTIRQKSSGRYVDAHQTPGKDNSLVTRPAQNNDTQRWIVTPLGNNIYTFRHKSSGRHVDAHQNPDKDYSLVTRPGRNNDTQRWLFNKFCSHGQLN